MFVVRKFVRRLRNPRNLIYDIPKVSYVEIYIFLLLLKNVLILIYNIYAEFQFKFIFRLSYYEKKEQNCKRF